MLTRAPRHEVVRFVDRGTLAPGLMATSSSSRSPDYVRKAGDALRQVYDMPAGADRLVSQASGIQAVVVGERSFAGRRQGRRRSRRSRSQMSAKREECMVINAAMWLPSNAGGTPAAQEELEWECNRVRCVIVLE